MAAIAIQVIVGEASSGHQPRSLSNDLWVITVGVTVDPVKHFAVTTRVLVCYPTRIQTGPFNTKSLRRRCSLEAHPRR